MTVAEPVLTTPQADAAAPSLDLQVLKYISTLPQCRAMDTVAEREAATELVRRVGLPSHHDHQKNWDTFKCLSYILAECAPDAPILDAGSGARAALPMWLLRLGYTNLHACDLRPPRKEILDPRIQFTPQDLTKTTYEDGSFQAISCISVIEHNVPLEPFAQDMSRILKPGGLLLVSTDYWPEPIDCSGIFPYGAEMGEMKIFDAPAFAAFVRSAQAAGLEPTTDVIYGAREKAVRWDRVNREYTFAFVALRKVR